MNTVFLCHASRDKKFVRRLASELRRNGVQVWLDEDEVKVGDSLRQAIERGIEGSDYVIVVLSRAALKREWVKRELSAAFALEAERRSKVVLPVLLQKMPLPVFLRDKKYADFSRNFNDGFREVLATVVDASFEETRGIETLKVSVLLDILRLDGSLVRYRKTQKIRAKVDGADRYTEAFSSDGLIDGYKVEPGTISLIWAETGTIHVETLFPNTLKEGQTLTRKFECFWRDSFTGAAEYWDQRVHHPSRNVEVLVSFPKGRPPKKWKVLEKKGAITRVCKIPVRLNEHRGKPTLQLLVKKPRMLFSYVLRWTW